jgi:hypothetical protein
MALFGILYAMVRPAMVHPEIRAVCPWSVRAGSRLHQAPASRERQEAGTSQLLPRPPIVTLQTGHRHQREPGSVAAGTRSQALRRDR